MRKKKSGDMPSEDIGGILRKWRYEEGRTVRRVRTASGREVIQVRLPLGIEQYEMNGRPDGKRPEGQESWLVCYEKKALALGREFVLDSKDCERLQSEGILYYSRYLVFFQVGDYALCARDTSRNLRLLDFVTRYARKEDCEPLEQYRPYILRMHIMSRVLLRLKTGKDVRRAVLSLRKGVAAVKALPPLENSTIYEFERERSVKSLEDLIRQLESQLPVSKRDALQKKMAEAISREDYETAASIRDQIRKLTKDA
jgi:hypothetical protein